MYCTCELGIMCTFGYVVCMCTFGYVVCMWTFRYVACTFVHSFLCIPEIFDHTFWMCHFSFINVVCEILKLICGLYKYTLYLSHGKAKEKKKKKKKGGGLPRVPGH
jgi:hypothetical protein